MRAWSFWWVLWVAIGLVACGGEEQAVVENPPAGEEPGPPQPPPNPPDPPDEEEPAAPTDAGPWVIDAARGQAQFAEKCQRCHGENAGGGYGPALNNTSTCAICADFTALWLRIDEFMPLRNPAACDAACARDIAAWISNGFSPAPSCSVEFTYQLVTAESFSAVVRIFNFRGQRVPDWRLGFTLPAGHAVNGVVDAVLKREGDQVLLSAYGSAGIADGQTLAIGLQGTHPGHAVVPTDLRLEASPCFTAPPAATMP